LFSVITGPWLAVGVGKTAGRKKKTIRRALVFWSTIPPREKGRKKGEKEGRDHPFLIPASERAGREGGGEEGEGRAEDRTHSDIAADGIWARV